MNHTSNPRRRWRRTALATAGISLIATVAPLMGANPAAAVAAPLATTDGIGVRIDENAILGPALELIENEIQPFANQMIYNGALANSPAGTPKWLAVSSNVELAFDFKNAGTTGYPQGGLSVHADIQDINIEYRKDPVWPFADCSIYVNPNDATIDASAYINTGLLPNAPLTLNPISATWDDDPDVSSTGVCWWWLIDDFFDSLFTSGGTASIADTIEAELNGQAQDLINDLWAEHVTPIINSLTLYGITFNQIRTDDHGLIVTANVDATNGILVPGDPGGVPRDVSLAQDAGVTSNVNTLLANRASDAIVSIHPNVANQFLFSLTRALSGQMGTATIPSSIESVLLATTVHGDYADAGWTVTLSMVNATVAPYITPTGTGGAPLVTFDPVNVIFRNTSKGTTPVAIFRGSLTGTKLLTVVRTGGTGFGPTYDPVNLAGSLTRFSGNADVVAFNAPASIAVPYAKVGIDYFDEAIFQTFATLAPISIGGLNVNLCTTCGRYSGDQRYTETFTVG
jgi:hypothetical protein